MGRVMQAASEQSPARHLAHGDVFRGPVCGHYDAQAQGEQPQSDPAPPGEVPVPNETTQPGDKKHDRNHERVDAEEIDKQSAQIGTHQAGAVQDRLLPADHLIKRGVSRTVGQQAQQQKQGPENVDQAEQLG